MTWFPIRSSRPRRSRAGRCVARTIFLPMASELEGRTLLSTLTVMNDHDSGPGSLPQEVALARSGDRSPSPPAWRGGPSSSRPR